MSEVLIMLFSDGRLRTILPFGRRDVLKGGRNSDEIPLKWPPNDAAIHRREPCIVMHIAECFAFEGFSLDPGSGTLRRGDEERKLRPKSFDVLWYLARNAGRVVSKEELFAAVWPSVVVGDDSLAHCVADIREALGDTDRNLVRTIAKRGYQLNARVQPVDEGEATLVPARSPSRAKRWRSRALSAAVAGIVLAIGATAYSIVANRRAPVVASPPISIVVLPLANLSGDAGEDYLAEALTNDLTTDLTRMRRSFVIARNSAARYKGKDADAAAIARDLGVHYVLGGSVRRLGDTVRLNLDMLEADTGRQIWAERFDADRSHVAGLQVRVTDSLAQTLRIELMGAEAARVRRERPNHPEAYDLAIRGWVLWNRQRPESVAAAREILLRSIALDPESAFAWNTLATTYLADILNRWTPLRGTTREEWQQRFEEAAARANALDADYFLPTCTVMMLQKRFEESLACRERGIARFPNDPLPYFMAAQTQLFIGRPQEVFALMGEAMRVSPRDTRLHNFHGVLAAAHLQLGQYRQALAMAEKSIELDPGYWQGHSLIAAAAAQLGQSEKARASLAEFTRLQPTYTRIASIRRDEISDRPAFLTQREHFYEGLRKAGLPD